MRVCAITNVYNEAFNLPIWLKHYSAQVGAENCIIIDNGSDDGSTENLGPVGRINMPRTKFSDHVRAELISGIVSSMLAVYDAVIYSDCDEMLVADPVRYRNLAEFCEKMETPATTAIGLNVYHHLDHEAPIDPRRRILEQRRFVQFVSPMCKTLVTKKQIAWGHGFHSSTTAPQFGDLYMFHIRWVDLGECLRRLGVTQKIDFAHSANHHHAQPKEYIRYFEDFTRRRLTDEFEFGKYTDKLMASLIRDDQGMYTFGIDLRSDEVIQIPPKFGPVF